jgi:uncharacterized membrane protein
MDKILSEIAYGIVFQLAVIIHVGAAIMGLGGSFVFSMIARRAKTTTQAKHILQLLLSLEILPKAGSILLLLTGLIFGIKMPYLFMTGWYITSIILYIPILVLIISVIPNNRKKQLDLVTAHTDEELPAQYVAIAKRSAKLEGMLYILVYLLIVLMVFRNAF